MRFAKLGAWVPITALSQLPDARVARTPSAVA